MLRPIILLASLLFASGAVAEEAPAGEKCVTVEQLTAPVPGGVKISNALKEPYLGNLKKLAEVMHADMDMANKADAIKITIAEDNSAGLFFVKGDCVVGVMPVVPPSQVEMVFGVIAGAPKTSDAPAAETY